MSLVCGQKRAMHPQNQVCFLFKGTGHTSPFYQSIFVAAGRQALLHGPVRTVCSVRRFRVGTVPVRRRTGFSVVFYFLFLYDVIRHVFVLAHYFCAILKEMMKELAGTDLLWLLIHYYYPLVTQLLSDWLDRVLNAETSMVFMSPAVHMSIKSFKWFPSSILVVLYFQCNKIFKYQMVNK